MESQADAYSSLVDIRNEEVGEPAAVDVSHENDSSEEAWFSEDFLEDVELHNEWKQRRDKLYTAGYREGLLEGQKDAAQDGFNDGFKDSVLDGYKWGIVRGVTSALAHIPDELKERLVENEEVRKEFRKLHNEVDSIGTGDALKLYYENIMREKCTEQSSTVNSDHLPSASGSGGLGAHVATLESLLLKSPAVHVHLKLNEKEEFDVIVAAAFSSSSDSC